MLIPFVEDFVPIVDLEKGEIIITPPEGLLDLSEVKNKPTETIPRRQDTSYHQLETSL